RCAVIRHVISALGSSPQLRLLFFYNDPPTTEIYTLSLHDALPISAGRSRRDLRGRHGPGDPDRAPAPAVRAVLPGGPGRVHPVEDRKSTRLNSSHLGISYAVFCLKKKI